MTAAIVADAVRAELAQQRVRGVQQLGARAFVHLREGLDVGAGREDDRDRGGDDHRADPVGRLDPLPDRAQVADHVGRDRVHRQVGEPGDRDVAARLQLDRLRLLALVGLRVGVEALARLEPEPALGDEPLQRHRRREALAVLLLEPLDPLEDRVEPLQVGFPERREEAFARVEPGPGHHPQVDVADRADALLDQLAGLDQRPPGEHRDQLLGVGLGLAGDVLLALLEEALAAALGAELAVGDETLQALVDVEALAVGLVEVLGDVQHRVEPEQVGEEERPHRRGLGGGDRLVDRLQREAAAPPGRARSRRSSPSARG